MKRCLYLGALFCALAVLGDKSIVAIDSPEKIPHHGWKMSKRADSAAKLHMVIAVKQQNVPELERTLMDVSDPDSDNYGNFLSNEAVHDLVAPSDHSQMQIRKWLLSSGIKESRIQKLTPNGDFLQIEVTVLEAEKLLNCKYASWTRSKTNGIKESILRVHGDYFVPALLKNHIDFISPTKRFPPHKPAILSEQPEAGVNPTMLRQLYKVGDAVGSASGNSQGIASFLGEYYRDADLEKFWKEYNLKTVPVTKKPPATKTGQGAEAELDVQYITGMGEGIPLQVYYTKGRAPGNPQNEPFLAWLTAVQNDSSAPLLFSVSYGEDEKSVSLSYATRINAEFAKLGTRGISIFFAAGDSGAGGNCTSARETPDFPSGSPYITAVGGVTGGRAGSNPIGERVWSGGGGGFSDRWPQPSYQTAAVNKYFQTAGSSLPPASDFNKSGRGYPDVSAQSLGFTIVVDGFNMGVSGTSAASPTTAGIFSLLNDLRLQKGMKPLGFVNPLLYKLGAENPSSFNDCTSGENTGCRNKGFPAVAGWDAASGFGSPNYAELAKYIIQTGEKTKRYN